MKAETKAWYTERIRDQGMCGQLSADEESVCIRERPCLVHNEPRERLRLAIEGVLWFDYSDDDDVVQKAVDELRDAWAAWDAVAPTTNSDENRGSE